MYLARALASFSVPYSKEGGGGNVFFIVDSLDIHNPVNEVRSPSVECNSFLAMDEVIQYWWYACHNGLFLCPQVASSMFNIVEVSFAN